MYAVYHYNGELLRFCRVGERAAADILHFHAVGNTLWLSVFTQEEEDNVIVLHMAAIAEPDQLSLETGSEKKALLVTDLDPTDRVCLVAFHCARFPV